MNGWQNKNCFEKRSKEFNNNTSIKFENKVFLKTDKKHRVLLILNDYTNKYLLQYTCILCQSFMLPFCY